MGHEFKVGDKVRRTSVEPIIEVKPGDIGVVIARPAGASIVPGVFVEWKPGTWFKYDERDQRKIEPADAPAVGAPGDGLVASDQCVKGPVGRRCQRFHGHNGSCLLPPAERAQSQMTDTARAQVDNRADLERAHASEEAEIAAAFTARAELADVKGERDKLRADVARLEGDVAWLRRENIRLGGRARGAR